MTYKNRSEISQR